MCCCYGTVRGRQARWLWRQEPQRGGTEHANVFSAVIVTQVGANDDARGAEHATKRKWGGANTAPFGCKTTRGRRCWRTDRRAVLSGDRVNNPVNHFESPSCQHCAAQFGFLAMPRDEAAALELHLLEGWVVAEQRKERGGGYVTHLCEGDATQAAVTDGEQRPCPNRQRHSVE